MIILWRSGLWSVPWEWSYFRTRSINWPSMWPVLLPARPTDCAAPLAASIMRNLSRQYRQKFFEGAAARGVSESAAEAIFKKFNGLYMFPESHAFAFGVTAYQASWLKYHYPLEFFVGLFNQQPMGFYNLETLKEDARRHGIRVLNPDINKSQSKCTIENGALRLGFLSVLGLGEAAAKAIEEGRKKGEFKSYRRFSGTHRRAGGSCSQSDRRRGL